MIYDWEGCVVVARLTGGEDILGVLVGVLDGTIMIEHPYYARFDPKNRSVIMIPYCPLSDEIMYEFSADKVQFVVPANKDVTNKFIELIKQPYDEPEPFDVNEFLQKLKGSDSKH